MQKKFCTFFYRYQNIGVKKHVDVLELYNQCSGNETSMIKKIDICHKDQCYKDIAVSFAFLIMTQCRNVEELKI